MNTAPGRVNDDDGLKARETIEEIQAPPITLESLHPFVGDGPLKLPHGEDSHAVVGDKQVSDSDDP